MGHIRVSVYTCFSSFFFLKKTVWTFAGCLNIVSPSLSGQEDYSFEELLPMAVIGVIGGLLGMWS